MFICLAPPESLFAVPLTPAMAPPMGEAPAAGIPPAAASVGRPPVYEGIEFVAHPIYDAGEKAFYSIGDIPECGSQRLAYCAYSTYNGSDNPYHEISGCHYP